MTTPPAPEVAAHSPKETAMKIDEVRKLIADMFTRHHADACYPKCYDFEAESFGDAILTALKAKGYVIEQGWRPIETAPRDGTDVILFGPYPENDQGLPTERVTAGYWLIPDPPYLGDCGGDAEEPLWMSQDGGFIDEWPATHWRPLPEPPTKDAGHE